MEKYIHSQKVKDKVYIQMIAEEVVEVINEELFNAGTDSVYVFDEIPKIHLEVQEN